MLCFIGRIREPDPHDRLTGLLSLDAVLAVLRERRAGAVVVIDLGFLVSLAGALSTSAADTPVEQAAATLDDIAGRSCLLGRIAPDRLVAISPEPDAIAAHALAGRLLTAMATRIRHWPGAGAGVAEWQSRTAAEGALGAAALSAHEAARDQRSTVRYDAGGTESLEWAERVRAALDADDLTLAAQPIIDLRTEVTARHELLVRMRDGDGGLHAAARFIPAATRFGLVTEIDLWVARRALQLAAAGHAVSLNVAARTLVDERFLDLLGSGAGDGTAPMVEVSESIVGQGTDDDACLRALRRLRSAGCRVAVDDFGAAGGRLAALYDWPVDEVKLNRRFAVVSRHGSMAHHALEAVLMLAERVGVRTVVEGVEHETDVPELRAAGVDGLQGMVNGPPTDAAACGLVA